MFSVCLSVHRCGGYPLVTGPWSFPGGGGCYPVRSVARGAEVRIPLVRSVALVTQDFPSDGFIFRI